MKLFTPKTIVVVFGLLLILFSAFNIVDTEEFFGLVERPTIDYGALTMTGTKNTSCMYLE